MKNVSVKYEVITPNKTRWVEPKLFGNIPMDQMIETFQHFNFKWRVSVSPEGK